MYTILILVIGVIIGISISLLYCFFKGRCKDKNTLTEEPIRKPLPQNKYDELITSIMNRYHDAMSQYDKLIPWAAAGGLVVSLGFIPKIVPFANEHSWWILGIAWLALVFSLLCSIISQYTSTRITVWYKKYIIACQSPPLKSASQTEKENWQKTTSDAKIRSDKNGLYTKKLNVLSYLLLAVGLIVLGIFAIFTLPFGNKTS